MIAAMNLKSKVEVEKLHTKIKNLEIEVSKFNDDLLRLQSLGDKNNLKIKDRVSNLEKSLNAKKEEILNLRSKIKEIQMRI